MLKEREVDGRIMKHVVKSQTQPKHSGYIKRIRTNTPSSKPIGLDQGWQILSGRSWIVNILDVVGRMFSVINCSTLQLKHENSHRQYVSEWTGLYYKIQFRK